VVGALLMHSNMPMRVVTMPDGISDCM
jgi:hypothetical protein